MILGCEMLDGGPLKECEEFRTEPPVPQVTQQKSSNTTTNDGERFTKKYVQQWIRVGTAKEPSPLVLVCFSEGSLRSSRMAYQIPQSRDLQRRHDNLHELMLTYIHRVLIEEASYYCGNRGMVKRIYCGVGMKTWEKKDDVLVDLVLWRSFCVMERGRLQIACKSPALIGAISGPKCQRMYIVQESLLGPPISQDSLNTDDSRNRVCLVGYMSLQEEDNTFYVLDNTDYVFYYLDLRPFKIGSCLEVLLRFFSNSGPGSMSRVLGILAVVNESGTSPSRELRKTLLTNDDIYRMMENEGETEVKEKTIKRESTTGSRMEILANGLGICPAVYPGDVSSRPDNFQGWGLSHVQEPQGLVRAGFYYTGYRDCVRCFYCVVGLRTWEKEDDPWVEHVRWRSSCDYVRSMMGEKFVEEALARNSRHRGCSVDALKRLPDHSLVKQVNLQRFVAILYDRTAKVELRNFEIGSCFEHVLWRSFSNSGPGSMSRGLGILAAVNESGTSSSEEFRKTLSTNDDINRKTVMNVARCVGRPWAEGNEEEFEVKEQNIERESAIGSRMKILANGLEVYPQYRDISSRLDSYQGWGWSHVQDPQGLARAGFYYAGYRDCVRCFCCGVGLRTWEKEDDPWVEHVRWRSSCDYVRSMMGEKFVEEVLSGNTEQQPPSLAESTAEKDALLSREMTSYITVEQKMKNVNKKIANHALEYFAKNKLPYALQGDDIIPYEPIKREKQWDKGYTFADINYQQAFVVCPFVSLRRYFEGMARDRERKPKEHFEGFRLQSFGMVGVATSAIRLAEAGFYATGNGDETKCYSCGVTKRNWQTRDSPIAVHQQISPNCLHVTSGDRRNVPIKETATEGPGLEGQVSNNASQYPYFDVETNSGNQDEATSPADTTFQQRQDYSLRDSSSELLTNPGDGQNRPEVSNTGLESSAANIFMSATVINEEQDRENRAGMRTNIQETDEDTWPSQEISLGGFTRLSQLTEE